MDPTNFENYESMSYRVDMAAEIDGDDISDTEVFLSLVGRGFAEVIRWQIGSCESIESIGRRTLALAMDMQPHLFDGRSGRDLSKDLGGSRAALSFWKKDFEKNFAVHFRPGKTLTAATVYAQNRRNVLARQSQEKSEVRDRLSALLAMDPVTAAPICPLQQAGLF